MTANCIKVTSPNLQATNGVIHVVEKIINPVSDTLLDQITSHPDLSFLKGGNYVYFILVCGSVKWRKNNSLIQALF